MAGADGAAPASGESDPRAFYEREVLPVLLAALEDEDAEVRSAAAVALGKMASPRALFALRKALKDDVRDVRDGAVLALGMIREPLAAEDLSGLLLDPKVPERTRCFAAVGLGLLGGEEGGRALLAFLDPKADDARAGGLHRTAQTEASAITGLGLSGFKPAIEPLRRDYGSDKTYEYQVRAFCSVALARLGDREAIPFLLQGLNHDREPMRQSAALALGALGTASDEPVVQALAKRLFEEKDINTRQFCLMSLARIGGDTARGAIRKYLKVGSKIDLPLIALALAINDDREMLPVLRRMFQEERNPSVKGALALALGLFHDIDSAPDMRRIGISQGDRELRALCLLALGLMGDKAAAPGVRDSIDGENDPGVKIALATCLGLLQDPSTVPVLEKLAKDGDNVYVRSNACRMLGNVGNTRSARVLMEILKNPRDNSVVRMCSAAGLGNLADRNLVPILSQVGLDANYASPVDPLIEIATIM
jgi:HEAT repeat protein